MLAAAKEGVVFCFLSPGVFFFVFAGGRGERGGLLWCLLWLTWLALDANSSRFLLVVFFSLRFSVCSPGAEGRK